MQKLLITKFGKQMMREEADDMTMRDCIALFGNGISKIEKQKFKDTVKRENIACYYI
jgi:hypothetical protein